MYYTDVKALRDCMGACAAGQCQTVHGKGCRRQRRVCSMAGRPVEAVIFDMDGLMIDSEPLWHVAEQQTFAAAGITLSEDDCNDTTGLRIDEVVAYHAERKPWGDTPTRAEVAQQVRA